MKQLLVVSLVAFTSTQVFAMDSLSNLVSKNRIVLVFGNADDLKVVRQTKVLLTQIAGLDERDMVVIGVTEDRATRIYGKVRALDRTTIREEADIVGNDFQVVLVGKDGGIKLRSPDVVSDIQMFDLIDRMPMRRSEQE
ncbi:DUF4174 domain-containing protein [Agrobacterium rubi]|uniref:DUF4174 domain-containing protein n=1 Tax=Agrobacterium rubi TaxID=28099 RepID=A0AAE7QYH3_9HYPH|nr:DUF4174 domain-containing protein [Agrobacterium rubi]NTE86359.1 DUF4174 domain-containing protein [Agrobacterium rubi]NTF02291.1 DUF4174 domain-containing protein [Agrobacterium rubi]NTF36535.1 DUF4174 domain-containing protein [Agrobacterium rubi]OCJ44211.1 hypothetical protein A6U92_17310 [Agrobacterium rubi]QTF98999.1 DUF4174 domain-containing protein [Agrobacterium rubi]